MAAREVRHYCTTLRMKIDTCLRGGRDSGRGKLIPIGISTGGIGSLAKVVFRIDSRFDLFLASLCVGVGIGSYCVTKTVANGVCEDAESPLLARSSSNSQVCSAWSQGTDAHQYRFASIP